MSPVSKSFLPDFDWLRETTDVQRRGLGWGWKGCVFMSL